MEDKTPLRFALVAEDPWLEPANEAIESRYARFKNTLEEIKSNWGSLSNFADGYLFYGFITTESGRDGSIVNGPRRRRTSISLAISTTGSAIRTG